MEKSQQMKEAIAVGHSIYLRAPCDEDVIGGNWHMWYNDYETTKYNSHGVFPITRDEELKYVQALQADRSKIVFSIVTVVDDILIGNVCLQNINMINRNAELAMTIGEAKYRNQPFSIEAVGLTLEHGFSRLNLNRIYGGTHEALAYLFDLYKIFGFENEGRLREHYYRDGQYSDGLNMAVLAKDYFALKNARGGNILLDNYSAFLKEVTRLSKS